MNGRPLKLLLVEDNPGDARLLRETTAGVKTVEFGLTHVEELGEALRRLSAERFDVILLDLSLPDSQGLNTLSRVQAHAPAVPVVVLTGLDDEALAVKAVQEGAQDYLVKGQVESNVLVRAIRYAIERHRLRQELRASEERYRNLFENANDGILSFTLDGRILDVNRGLEVMLGWSREELIEQHYSRLGTPASIAQGEERTRRVLAGEKPSSIFEAEIVRKDGRIVPVEVRSRFIRDKDGQPTGIQAILREVSARKALERQRAEFLAMLTHDIKNPLMVILGYADLLLEEAEEQASTGQDDAALWMKSSALTILSLVDNYLDLSRIEDGRLAVAREPVALNDLLVRVGRQYGAAARNRQVTLELQLLKDLPFVEGDLLALERVFVNLVYNALKFTPGPGRVTISSARHKDGEVVVAVTDTGPGIAPAELPLLFEKYQRAATARHQQGTGLGLFIAKTLVDAHGGRLEVQSTLGSGTCFRVILPVTAG